MPLFKMLHAGFLANSMTARYILMPFFLQVAETVLIIEKLRARHVGVCNPASVDYHLVADGLFCVVVVKRHAWYPQGRKEIRQGVFYCGRYRIRR